MLNEEKKDNLIYEKVERQEFSDRELETVTGGAGKVGNTGKRAYINREECVSCGVCSAVCEMEAIDINSRDEYEVLGPCNGCGLCVDNCPCLAITLI